MEPYEKERKRPLIRIQRCLETAKLCAKKKKKKKKGAFCDY